MDYWVDAKRWFEDWQDIEWRWVFLAGVLISLGTVVTVAGIIAIYSGYVFTLDSSDPVANALKIEQFADPVENYGSVFVHLVMTYGVSAWVIRRVGTAVNLHGLLVGVMSGTGLLIQAIVFSGDALQSFPMPFLLLLLGYALPISFGQLGANRGYRHSVTQEKFYQTIQAIQHAATPQAIVNGIGQGLSKPRIAHVGLWKILLQGARGTPTAVSPLAVWSVYEAPTHDLDPHLTQANLPSLLQLEARQPVFSKVEKERITETAVWDILGVRSLMVLPLIAPAGNWVGVMTIGSQANGGFSQEAKQDYITIGSQVSLILDLVD